jgi:hypothetical protein
MKLPEYSKRIIAVYTWAVRGALRDEEDGEMMVVDGKERMGQNGRVPDDFLYAVCGGERPQSRCLLLFIYRGRYCPKLGKHTVPVVGRSALPTA